MPDLTRTRTALISRVARKARLTASGQSLETDDSAVIDDVIDGVLMDLAARDVVYVGDAEAIDNTVFEWVAAIIAELIAPDFGKQTDYNLIELAERKLRAITSAGGTREVLKTEYF